jgi:hypothetical protein
LPNAEPVERGLEVEANGEAEEVDANGEAEDENAPNVDWGFLGGTTGAGAACFSVSGGGCLSVQFYLIYMEDR